MFTAGIALADDTSEDFHSTQALLETSTITGMVTVDESYMIR